MSKTKDTDAPSAVLKAMLFLAREAVRRACIRSDGSAQLQRLINQSWIVLPLGFVLAYVSERLFTYYSTPDELAIPHYTLGLQLFAIGSLLELASEPVYILSANMLLFKVRTLVEGSALFLRAVSTYYYVVILNDGLKGFGYAQIIYAATLLIGYYGSFLLEIRRNSDPLNHKDKQIVITSVKQLLPRFGPNDKILGTELTKLTMLYTWQSIWKLLLTEGEKVVLFLSESLQSQAIFSIVSNLGSLIARFFFQPIEEMCFTMFPKLFKGGAGDVRDGTRVLQVLMRVMITIACLFISFGPAYSHILLHLLYRAKFDATNASVILSFYCIYVGFIAINGVSEAFVHSVAKPDQLRVVNWVLIANGVFYLVCTAILSRLYGTIGIIIANCLNMMARIAYSLYFMKCFFKESKSPFGFQSMLPSPMVQALFVLSFFVTLASKQVFGTFKSTDILAHIGVGGSLLLAIVFALDEIN
eukprot:gene3811-4395_t